MTNSLSRDTQTYAIIVAERHEDRLIEANEDQSIGANATQLIEVAENQSAEASFEIPEGDSRTTQASSGSGGSRESQSTRASSGFNDSEENQSSGAFSELLASEIESKRNNFNFSRKGLRRCKQMEQKSRELFQDQYSYDQLKAALEKILKETLDQEISHGAGDIIEDLIKLVEDIPDEYEKAYALAILFYTSPVIGRYEWSSSSLEINRFLDLFFASAHFPRKNSAYSVFASFLIKALGDLQAYQGECIRTVNMSPGEEALYKEGAVVTWKYFNSSSKGKIPAPGFEEKNTRFIIQSCTGRFIAPFSHVPKENEVLFSPGCSFIVLKKELRGTITYIYLWEVELEITENTVDWAEMRIEDKYWEDQEDLDRFLTEKYQHALDLLERPSIPEELKPDEKLRIVEEFSCQQDTTCLESSSKQREENLQKIEEVKDDSLELSEKKNFDVNLSKTEESIEMGNVLPEWLLEEEKEDEEEAPEALFEEERKCLDSDLQGKEGKLLNYLSNDPLLSTGPSSGGSHAKDQNHHANTACMNSVFSSENPPSKVIHLGSENLEALAIEEFNRKKKE